LALNNNELICIGCDYRTDERYFAHLQQLKSNGMKSMDEWYLYTTLWRPVLATAQSRLKSMFGLSVPAESAVIVLTYCKSSRRCFFTSKSTVDCDCRERVHYVHWNSAGYTAHRTYTQRLSHDLVSCGFFRFWRQ